MAETESPPVFSYTIKLTDCGIGLTVEVKIENAHLDSPIRRMGDNLDLLLKNEMFVRALMSDTIATVTQAGTVTYQDILQSQSTLKH